MIKKDTEKLTKNKKNSFFDNEQNVNSVGLSENDKEIVSRLLSEYSNTLTSLYMYDKRKENQ